MMINRVEIKDDLELLGNGGGSHSVCILTLVQCSK